MGNLIFLVLNDSSGFSIQAISREKEMIEKITSFNKGDLVELKGVLKKKKDLSGDLEIEIGEIKIINYTKEIPFEINDNIEIKESTRFKYRYLDIRRNKSKKPLLLKSDFIHEIRNFLHKEEFVDIETPVLSQFSPEGSNCFVVPSNIKDRFYTLSQSPQIFKQMLMVGGIDKYYQVAKSFRNEDARSNRQIEFSQLDIEMSFVDSKKIQKTVEKLLKRAIEKVFSIKVKTPFLSMNYREVMEIYGNEKPKLEGTKEGELNFL
jgi:aspartyl-tRNA synthetase